MADEALLAILRAGVPDWNLWRREAAAGDLDLSGADLSGADLSGADLSGADLSRADLSRADLSRADLSRADLTAASLHRADLTRAAIMNARLVRADLSDARLSDAELSYADLSEANLTGAMLLGSNIEGASLRAALVHGVSVWRVSGTPSTEADLLITQPDEPPVTVDSLASAQFIYLLLTSDKLRDVIDTVTSKIVLILGRFSGDRLAVPEMLRDELRLRNLTPVFFDMGRPASPDVTNTVQTLARLSRFIIVDLTDPGAIPQELAAIIPAVAVPVVPLIQSGSQSYAMFGEFRRYPWVLSPHSYSDAADLLKTLDASVLGPAEAKVAQLEGFVRREPTR